MPREVTASGDMLRCPYCDQPVRFRGDLIVARCEHLAVVQGHRDGSSTATFKAVDDIFVYDTDRPPPCPGVYVKRDDPRYARAYDAGHVDPGSPPPIR